jgi:hypothetical protein
MTSLLLSTALSVMTGITVPTAGVRAAVVVQAGHVHHTGPAEMAFRQGYRRGERDGARYGRADARHHRRPLPERHQRFREGDRGYKHRYGPHGAYVDGYRQGFQVAYRTGFKRTAHWRH